MIEIDGKVYRNVQEQVKKNMDDIETLKKNSYTKTETDTLLNAKASKNGSASEDFTTNNLTVSGNETLAGDLVYNGNTSLTSKMATKADLNNNNQVITAKVFNSIGGYFYITGHNATTQYYSDKIYNSTNHATWLFPSAGGTFARTSDIASAKSELQTKITANADKIDNAINDLRWELGSHTLDVESDTTTAFSKSVPANTIGCQINKIGGMSYKSTYFEGIRDSAVTSVVSKGANLLKLVADTSGTAAGVRYNISNGVVTLNGTSTSTEGFWISLNTTVTAGEYYFEIFNALNQGNSTFIRLDNAGTSAVALVRGTSTGTRLTLSEGEFKAFFWIGSSGITFNNLVIYPMLVSGSTAPSEFIAYEGTIATTTIPSEVQSLTGYGWGINENCYNYIDYEAKKFIKKVGRVDLGSLNWSYSTTFYWRANLNVANKGNAICSTYVCSTNRPDQLEVGELSTYWVYIDNVARIIVNNGSDTTKPSGILIYELAEPVETDISEYIDDNSIEVEPNGTLTFNNTYEQAVPSDIDYLIEEVKA